MNRVNLRIIMKLPVWGEVDFSTLNVSYADACQKEIKATFLKGIYVFCIFKPNAYWRKFPFN